MDVENEPGGRPDWIEMESSEWKPPTWFLYLSFVVIALVVAGAVVLVAKYPSLP